MLNNHGQAVAAGFTLIELLVVVGIMTTLAFMSVSFYSRFFLQNAVANTVDQVVGTLRKAQTYSMMGKNDDKWGVNYSASKITLFKGSALGVNPAFNESFTVNSNVTITGLTETTFARGTGIPSGILSITVSSTNNNSKTITVNSQGVTSE